MHLSLPKLQEESVTSDVMRELLFRVANVFFNNDWGRFRVTLDTIRKGGIAAFGSVLYDPADEFQLGHSAPETAYPHLLEQLETVEQIVQDNYGLELARNPQELEACLIKERPVLFHCMEGAIGLGGDAAHLQDLARRGLAYIIVAHLFFKGAATCNNAIPFFTDSQFAKINDQPADVGLTKHGEEVVECALREGVIVDVTHCTDQAVDDIFRIHDSRGEYKDRPIISSHNGVRGTSNHPLNLSDANIERIRKTGGVIGVIFYPHWLLPPGKLEWFDDHIGLVFKAVDYIHDRTGSYDHIAIGTDLDGFIVPVHEIQTMSDVPRIEDDFTRRYGAQVAEIILRDNALRVLKNGWRGATASSAR
jgi:microsomal dipeptidase-like Zn-dependent dipeptidase